MPNLNDALHYLKMGYSIIPVSRKKICLLRAWSEYQIAAPSEDDVRWWWTKWPNANIAVICGKVNDIFAVDCDSAEGIEIFSQYLRDTETPCQDTPRGGRHYIFRYETGVYNNTKILTDIDTRGEGGYFCVSPSLSMDDKPYQWVAGHALGEIEIARIDPEYLKILRAGKKDKEKKKKADVEMFQEGRRDDDLFHTANLLVKGGMPEDEITQVLTHLVGSWGENDPKWVQSKVGSALKRAGKYDDNRREIINEYINGSVGQFSLPEVVWWVGTRDIDEKRDIFSYLRNLEQLETITKVGGRHGTYRLVDKSEIIMDINKKQPETLKVNLPFQLSEMCRFYSKNVILCAGEKDAGKTAFALNTAYMNRNNFRVKYFSSEAGEDEVQARIDLFPQDEFDRNEWSKITWVERSNRYEDVIDPDGMNIIDFLEIGADAYTVAEDIRRVFERLRKGLLVVVMQKRSYKTFAVGGEATLEKARLAINLEHGEGNTNLCRITVAKNWTGRIVSRPRGMVAPYKLYQGGKMVLDGPWREPEVKEKKNGEKKVKGDTSDFAEQLNWMH